MQVTTGQKKATDKVNVSGTILVIVIVATAGIIAIVMALVKPSPMSSVEVARQKQLEVYQNPDYCSQAELQQLSQETLEGYIGLLNYVIRIEDSLTHFGGFPLADTDSEYTLAEANQRLVIVGLAQRGESARAKAEKVIGHNLSPAIDSLYELVHQPMPMFPEDSVAIRTRNLTIERYEAIINN